MKILVIVPAFNEQEKIGAVLDDLAANGFRDIVVINDGSGDQTADIARRKGKPVLTHIINRGLGAALGSGLEYARKNGFDIAVTFDADGQHRAADIKRLISPLISGQSDMVIGSRLIEDGRMPRDREILNWLSNILTYLLYGVWTTDSQSGLRAFNKKALTLINIKTDRMEVSSEFFREVKRNGLRFSEIPIPAIYTDYSRQKGQEGFGNLNAVRVAFKMLLRIFR